MEYNNLKMDYEGTFSLSWKKDADILSKIIKEIYSDVKIIDATAGVGGNSISFGTYFSNVTSIEMDTERFNLLVDNLNTHNIKNKTINGNFLDYLDIDYNLIFIDLPWGGPSYKYKNSISLSIDNISLYDLIKKINNKIIVLKLPFNYDMNEFSQFNYTIYKINKYQVIIIDCSLNRF